MSAFNGSGTYVISGTGLPFVTATTISSTVANQLNTDLAAGLSTAICKDGQTTPTANIPMGGFKLTGVAAATTTGDALSYGRAATVTTLGATGNATFDASAAVHTTIGGWSGSALFESLAGAGTAVSGYNIAATGQALLARVDATGCNLVNFCFSTGSVGTISTNGSATAYNTASDQRLKANIADAADAGSIIDALRVRSWDWKTTGAHEAFGFVAQEEVAVAPFAVLVGDSDPNTITEQWGRDDAKLVPLLVKESQSQRARLAAAESLIADLLARVTALEA